MRGQTKTQIGVVVGTGRTKTVVVEVERRAMDKRFKKFLKRTRRFKVHDGKGQCRPGDRVLIVEGRPISREKSWSVRKVLVRGEVVEAIADTPELAPGGVAV